MKHVLGMALYCAALFVSCGPRESGNTSSENEKSHFGSLQIIGFQSNVPPQDGPGTTLYNFDVYKDGDFVKYDMTGYRISREEEQEHSEKNVGQFGMSVDANIFGFEESIVWASIETGIQILCERNMPYIDVPTDYSRVWEDADGKSNVNLTFNLPVQTLLMDALNFAHEHSDNCNSNWEGFLSNNYPFIVNAKFRLRYRLKSGAPTETSEIIMVFQTKN
jgi:hypothetical protein